jgi:hypothetical protein
MHEHTHTRRTHHDEEVYVIDEVHLPQETMQMHEHTHTRRTHHYEEEHVVDEVHLHKEIMQMHEHTHTLDECTMMRKSTLLLTKCTSTRQ